MYYRKSMVKETPKQPTYFDVKIETHLPATLIYRVLADDPEQAVEKVKYIQPTQIKHRLQGRRDFKIMVYDHGTTIIRYIKNLLGY